MLLNRALIERNNNRLNKSFEFSDKAKEAERKAQYWEDKAKEITLAMPESLEYFNLKLEQAIKYRDDLKSGKIKETHSYSKTYAQKDVRELKKKVETAKILWG